MQEVENYSYIVGLSQFCYYGVLSVKGTIDSSIFVKYLKGVINQIKQGAKYSKEYVIIWDNAIIHRSEIWKTFLESQNIGLLTIHPYSPWLNPIEHYIGSIK